MNTINNPINITENKNNNDKSINKDTIVDSIKILSEFTKKDIEKSYNLDKIKGTVAYFSNRYGWILRRTKD